MILPTEEYSFKLLTACFCGGADQAASAEMRVPSIRGQVRAWHREISGSETVNRIWGSTVGETGASHVALFWDATTLPSQAQPKPYILPHKRQGFRPALAVDQSFIIKLQRLVGCSTGDWTASQNAVKLWLLIGCLGLRANRAAGSVWPIGDWVPKTPTQFDQTVRSLGFRWPVQLVDTPAGTKADALRALASDTVKGQPRLFGSITPRVPSPTKFKVVELAGQLRLLVTSRPPVSLSAARTALSGNNKAGQFPWNPL
jgi:hypothetical protein